jgi:hypothetical protein
MNITSKIILLAASGFFSTGVALAQTQTVAGVVKKTEGSVEIIRDGKSMPATVGTIVLSGDTLKTAKGANAGVMLKDETRVALGASSQVALDKFAFNAESQEGNLVVNVVKGTFAMISGLLVKHNPDSTQIKTPTTTAGVRGTRFVVEVP